MVSLARAQARTCAGRELWGGWFAEKKKKENRKKKKEKRKKNLTLNDGCKGVVGHRVRSNGGSEGRGRRSRSNRAPIQATGQSGGIFLDILRASVASYLKYNYRVRCQVSKGAFDEIMRRPEDIMVPSQQGLNETFPS